jgi:hypothetical protein
MFQRYKEEQKKFSERGGLFAQYFSRWVFYGNLFICMRMQEKTDLLRKNTKKIYKAEIEKQTCRGACRVLLLYGYTDLLVCQKRSKQIDPT